MLENNRKITINKINILISICFICLCGLAFLSNMDYVAAVDSNESIIEVEMDMEVEDKLENSQNIEILNANEYSESESTFEDIRDKVNKANDGDTIELTGKYVAKNENDPIKISKRLTITSSEGAILDGKNISSIFVLDNKASGSVFSNLKFINANGHIGSALCIRSDDVKVQGCSFENNFADYRGGALYIYGKNLLADNCSFHYNKAADMCGGLFANFDGSRDAGLVVKNSIFTYNSAKNGGALVALSNNSKIINCYFDHNFVEAETISYGGAIQIGLDTHSSFGNVYDCIFSNNVARVFSPDGESHGGAGCVRNGSSYYNCIFINNVADYGAALTYHANGTIKNCSFIGNVANKYGGAIAIKLLHNNMNLNITDCIFEANKAPYGGAIKLSGMNIKIENSTFDENYASIDGAAVNIEADNVDVINSKFNKNIAENDGGAIFIISKNTYVGNSSFMHNVAVPNENKLADGLGGAIYVNSTNALIENSVFKFNTARNGSAIYYDKYGKNLKMSNNTLFENQAWVYWLPIYAKDIYYGDSEEIKAIIYGGNNIADYDNLAVSNAIYNAADNSYIEINNEIPIDGATMTGQLYQDSREYNIKTLLTIEHEDGTIIYNNSLNSNYLGEIMVKLNNLSPGKYFVTAKHFEDTYYKAITNKTSFRVIPKVDIAVSKSTNSSSYNYDDIVIWTIKVTNYGPNNATGVYLVDILPDGLILLDNLNDFDNGKLDIGSLNVGESKIITIKTLVHSTGLITNKVNVNSTELDVNLSNNYDEEIILVNPASDLEVNKQVNNTSPHYLDSVIWVITVTNNGPDVAHNVILSDVLPKGLVLQDIFVDYDKETGKLFIGDLEVNQKFIFNMTTLVNSTGLMINNVSVKANEYDYDLYNNNDSEIILVDSAADLAIVKTVNCTVLNYGDLVKWTLNIVNYGPSNATGVKIKEILPDGFIFINATKNFNVTSGCFDIGDLNSGESLTVDIICKVNKTGYHNNVANISGNEYDYNMSNNEDNRSVVVNPATDLGVIKLVNESELNYGDFVIWTIHVYNNGPDIAHEVNVTDMFDKSLIWLSDDSEGRFNPATGIWNVGTLNVGEIKTLNIKSQVNSTGLVENEVEVSGLEFDYNLTNNQDVEVITVNESADLSIVKLVNSTNVNYGDLVKWTLIVSNKGPSNATGVVVWDILPEGLIFINSTSTKGIYDNGKWVVCCLDVGSTQTLEIICKVNKSGHITNIATISGNEYDQNLTNNNDTESIDVPKSADIQVIKTVNNTNPFYGEHILWTIVVKNNGPDNASFVKVYDELPNGLIFVEYNATVGVYNNNIWDVGFLENGESQKLEVKCLVNELASIVNYATADCEEYDWNKSNNDDSAQVDVNPVCDLAVIKSVDKSIANYGDTVKWTISVLNNGPNDATGVVVEDMLPYGLKLLKSTGNYDGMYWNVGDLANGETKVLDIFCKVESTGHFINSVEVYGNEYDPDSSNNADDEELYINLASDLSVTKKASKDKYYVGDLIEYVIEVTNNGPDIAKNIKVSEILDDSLILKSFKTSIGKFDRNSCIWLIDSLEVGQKAKLVIFAQAVREGVVKNKVDVMCDNYDYNLTNNNDSVIVHVSNFTNNQHEKHYNKSKEYNVHNAPKFREEFVSSNIKRYTTANPVVLLLISIVFSAGSLPVILKRR